MICNVDKSCWKGERRCFKSNPTLRERSEKLLYFCLPSETQELTLFFFSTYCMSGCGFKLNLSSVPVY